MATESIFHRVVRGREEPFEDEESRFVATLRVVLSHRPGMHSASEDGLKCVAHRAAHAAAEAYNFFDTRIVSVEVVDVEEASTDA